MAVPLTRHLLLMTATPHNGKEADFQLFLALLDGDRFEGRFRDGVHQVVSAKLSAKAALLTSGALPENVNYAVKSSFLLGFLESVPEVGTKLKEANTKDVKFEDIVEQSKKAAVLVLVY